MSLLNVERKAIENSNSKVIFPDNCMNYMSKNQTSNYLLQIKSASKLKTFSTRSEWKRNWKFDALKYLLFKSNYTAYISQILFMQLILLNVNIL